ncbi:Uncharacterised protein [Escherichia coli]|nr:Uncharacterised protein [Escherichia coli]
MIAEIFQGGFVVFQQQFSKVHFEAATTHNAHHHDVGGFTAESEGRNLPTAQTQTFREVVQGVSRIFTIFQFEANRRDAFVRATRTDELIRPQFGDFIRQISGNLVRGVLYFGIAFTTEAQEFIVLCNYLTRRAGEVDGKSTNLTTQVVNVEHQFLRQRFFVTPDNPAAAQRSQTEFMA